MTEPDVYVSDAERERTVASLRDHLLAGRLTLDEFSERIAIAYDARVGQELTRAQDGLPTAGARALDSRRRPMRLTIGVLSHIVRRGRLRVRRWTVATTVLSDIDLDLRQAELDRPASAVMLLVAFGNVDVYVPEGVNVTVGGLSILGHRRDWGHDAAHVDAPIVRVRVISVFGTVDVWRVPPKMKGDYETITRKLQHSKRQLPA